MFLNQFSLKTIYDELVMTDPANEPKMQRRSSTQVAQLKSKDKEEMEKEKGE